MPFYRITSIAESGFKYEIRRTCFQQMCTELLDKLEQLSIEVQDDSHISDNQQHVDSNSDECYVYIMSDEVNNCYKIGISNKPSYREKTLQSDKPFITLLQAKRFPTRKLARSFESALHSAYEDKNIRGEWFRLSEKEVSEVIEALK